MKLHQRILRWTLVCLTLSTALISGADDALSTYTLAGGPTSYLFSECIADSLTVEGSLYAISVSDDEEYQRYAPERTIPMVWTDVDLGQNSDILECAMAAYEQSALMFKYEDGCSITLTDAYNPSSRQSCDDEPGEVVYISTRVSDMTFFGDVLVDGDTLGCLTKSDDWVYGVEDGRVVDEDTLPPRDTCCTSAAADYCLVAECSDEPMAYCEAEARCLARGLRVASRQFHETVDVVDPAKLGTDEYYFWVNVYQVQDDVWKWQDDDSDLVDFVWCGGPYPPASNCAAIHFTDAPHKIEYYRTQCNGTEVNCILCYDADDILPAC